jgi:hypothetical protein
MDTFPLYLLTLSICVNDDDDASQIEKKENEKRGEKRRKAREKLEKSRAMHKSKSKKITKEILISGVRIENSSHEVAVK